MIQLPPHRRARTAQDCADATNQSRNISASSSSIRPRSPARPRTHAGSRVRPPPGPSSSQDQHPARVHIDDVLVMRPLVCSAATSRDRVGGFESASGSPACRIAWRRAGAEPPTPAHWESDAVGLELAGEALDQPCRRFAATDRHVALMIERPAFHQLLPFGTIYRR